LLLAITAPPNLDVKYNLFTKIGSKAIEFAGGSDATVEPIVLQDAAPGTYLQVSAGLYHTCAVRSDRTLVCWGHNVWGSRRLPPAASRRSAPAYVHSCGLRTDGTLACWGNHDIRSVPPSGTFTQVSASLYHSCAVRSDGAVTCWGNNTYGQSSPPAGAFAQISTGLYHTCGIRTDGTIGCWGWNLYGQTTPPAGAFADVTAGSNYTCAVRSNGTATCWGASGYGQNTAPPGDYAQVSSSAYHTCAVMSDASVTCWGWNAYQQATPPAGGFAQVSASAYHTCGVTIEGSVVCWGSNGFGQSTPPPSRRSQAIAVTRAAPGAAEFNSVFTVAAAASSGLPVAVSVSGACSISTGTVTMTSGTGVCMVTFEQAGNASYAAAAPVVETVTARRAAPVVVVAGGVFTFDGATHTATGFAYGVGGITDVLSPPLTFTYQGTGSTSYGPTATAQSSAGTYTAIGSFAGNADYTPGANSAAIRIEPETAPPDRAPAITSADTATFTAGSIGTFTITTSGSPSVATIAAEGALPAGVTFTDNGNGNGTATLSGRPDAGTTGTYPLTITADNGIPPVASQSFTLVVNPARHSGFIEVAAGFEHSCARRSDGTVRCWGGNTYRQSTTTSQVFTQIAAGLFLTCGIEPNGIVACWGDYLDQSELSLGTFRQISVSEIHGCGVKADGTVACWGNNAYRATIPPPDTFIQVDAGWFHTCGVKTDHTVACWGDGMVGRAIPAGSFSQISAGSAFACGVRDDGSLTCWGDKNNTFGLATPPSGTFTQVAAGHSHACGLKSDGTLVCWGDNLYLQTTSPAGTFTQVSTESLHTCAVRSDGTVACWGDNGSEQSTVPTAEESPAITSAGATTFIIGSAGTFTITTTGTPEVGAIRTTGTLPSGVILRSNRDGTATLIGTPDPGTAGDYRMTITATNGVLPDAVQSFTLTVKEPAPPPPGIAVTIASPADGAIYTPGQEVVASYTCSSANAIASCIGLVPSGAALDTSTAGTFAFTVNAADSVGNVSSASVSYTVAGEPTITIISPAEPIYELGSAVLAVYSCGGAVSCTGGIANGDPIDTSTPGRKTFEITASHPSGEITATVTYSVSLGTSVTPFAGLSAWLPGNGSARDVVSGIEASWSGAEAYGVGKVAQRFALDGAGHASLPFSQPGPFALQAWVRAPDRLRQEFTGIISTGGSGQRAASLQIELDGSGNYRLNAGDSDLSWLIGPATDFFQHIAVTFDGVSVSVYLNGELVQRDTWNGPADLGFQRAKCLI
jgi:alpha-tubulin suppressor-like RCC1 family protein